MGNHEPRVRRSWTFHPLELAFCGYSGSGKTTLLAKLVPLLGLRLGYIKHDVHKFSMDHPGKDTFVLKEAGASTVFISNAGGRALLKTGPLEPQLAPLDWLDCDAVLVEGHKRSALPKIIVLDEHCEILTDEAFADQAPLAVVGPWVQAPALPWDVPYFQRDAVPDIADFVRGFWQAKLDARPVYGLVLTGGASRRMGQDKAALVYHEKPQADRAAELLQTVCTQVFVSCRADQAEAVGRRGHAQIHDQFLGLGPLSGILSAMTAHPEAAWLVVACDLPRLDAALLQTLAAGRRPWSFATAFAGSDGFPEPLCTIYEPKARSRLLQFLAMDYDCPRKMLINSPVQLLTPPDPEALVNANEPADRERMLHGQRG